MPATQPMPPSERQILMSGKRTRTFEYSQSTALYMPYAPKRTAGISGGASDDVVGEVPDEPTCRHNTVPVSAHAANSGSQYPEWIVGRPSLSGASENVTALKPRAALRWISAAAISGSRRYAIWFGMKRSGFEPHHASRCQSLYARIAVSASSSESGHRVRR